MGADMDLGAFPEMVDQALRVTFLSRAENVGRSMTRSHSEPINCHYLLSPSGQKQDPAASLT